MYSIWNCRSLFGKRLFHDRFEILSLGKHKHSHILTSRKVNTIDASKGSAGGPTVDLLFRNIYQLGEGKAIKEVILDTLLNSKGGLKASSKLQTTHKHFFLKIIFYWKEEGWILSAKYLVFEKVFLWGRERWKSAWSEFPRLCRVVHLSSTPRRGVR